MDLKLVTNDVRRGSHSGSVSCLLCLRSRGRTGVRIGVFLPEGTLELGDSASVTQGGRRAGRGSQRGRIFLTAFVMFLILIRATVLSIYKVPYTISRFFKKGMN